MSFQDLIDRFAEAFRPKPPEPEPDAIMVHPENGFIARVLQRDWKAAKSTGYEFLPSGRSLHIAAEAKLDGGTSTSVSVYDARSPMGRYLAARRRARRKDENRSG